MEPPMTEVPKIPDMVMCGDHPSFTKTELNAKVLNPVEKEKTKADEKPPMSYERTSPTPSQTERTASEVALGVLASRRRVRSLEAVGRTDFIGAHADRALLQAAAGSVRWPPYLVCVWVLAVVLTHALHSLIAVLDNTLPNLKKVCAWSRRWAEAVWAGARGPGPRACAVCAGLLAGTLHALHGALAAGRALALWACASPTDSALNAFSTDGPILEESLRRKHTG